MIGAIHHATEQPLRFRNLRSRREAFKRADDRGLYVMVKAERVRLVGGMDYRIGGKRKKRSAFGAFPEISLTDARDRAGGALGRCARRMIRCSLRPTRRPAPRWQKPRSRIPHQLWDVSQGLLKLREREGSRAKNCISSQDHGPEVGHGALRQAVQTSELRCARFLSARSLPNPESQRPNEGAQGLRASHGLRGRLGE